MKYKKLLILSLVSAQLAFAQDAYEPDNNIGTSSTLVSGTTQEHSFHGEWDGDYYKIVISSEKDISLTFESKTNWVPWLSMTLYDSAENILVDTFVQVFPFTHVLYTRLHPGTYYLKVIGSIPGGFDTPMSYEMSLKKDPPGTLTGISGIVTDSFGDPLQGIRVYASETNAWNGFAYQYIHVHTDTNGRYYLLGLSSGDKWVKTETDREVNYADEYYDDIALFDSYNVPAGISVVSVISNSVVSNINFALEAGGIITGSVTDDLGNPISNITIGTTAGEYTTDSNGTYTIRGLPAGSHVLHTTSGNSWFFQYYDMATNEASATPVNVSSGQTISNIDFSLVKKDLGTIFIARTNQLPKISWNAYEGTWYQVERSVDLATWEKIYDEWYATENPETYTDAGFPGITNYYYRVLIP